MNRDNNGGPATSALDDPFHRSSRMAADVSAPLSMALVLAVLGCVLGITLGLANLYLSEPFAYPILVLIGYATMMVAFVWSVRSTGDLFNPVTVIVILFLARYTLQILIVSVAGYSYSGYPLLSAMALTPDAWNLGHAMAITGVLGVLLGWLPAIRKSSGSIRQALPSTIAGVSIAGMVVGFAILFLFVSANASIVETLSAGTFRATPIAEGTGWYFRLALMLISGSVLLTGYLVHKGQRFYVALIPVLIAAVSFFVLGGRARAVTPVAAGFLLLWYRRTQRKRWRMPSVLILISAGILGVLFLGWVGNFGRLYRSGGGIEALDESFSVAATVRYFEDASLREIGHLHALAGAVLIEPGVLEGRTFLYALLWPVSEWIGLSGPSTGVFIAEFHLETRGLNWGPHPSLLGDAYLNVGIWAVPLVGAAFGYCLSWLYRRFRSGSVTAAFYALGLIYLMRLFFESVGKWPEVLVAEAFLAALIWAANRLSTPHEKSTFRPLVGPPRLLSR